jgi:hypothetical protein
VGVAMHKLRVAVALTAMFSLVACQTVDGVRVNGLPLTNDTRPTTQSGGSGWMWALGIAGAIGVGLLAAGGGGGGGGRVGPTGGGTGGGGMGPAATSACQGCWDY